MSRAGDAALAGWSKTRATGPLPGSIGELPTPSISLSRQAYRFNIAAIQQWCDERSFRLAPHGKTTMAPALWDEQLAAGAWGITVATEAQARLAVAAGVPVVQLANMLVRAEGIAALLAEAALAGSRVITWVDSEEAVELLERHAPAGIRPEVFVEFGSPGGRTGVRSAEALVALADRVTASGGLRLAGVAAYEGAIGDSEGVETPAVIRDYVLDAADAARRVVARSDPDADFTLSIGGSAHLDVIGAALVGAGLPDGSIAVVLRPGVTIVHDDGYYAHRSTDLAPDFPRLRSALHVWARVLSTPEPGLALLDAGRRDLPYDQDLPIVMRAYRNGALVDMPQPLEVRSLNDQHAFVGDPASALEVGDLVMLGLSHPCSAFDRWAEIPVVEGEATPDAAIVDLVRTFF